MIFDQVLSRLNAEEGVEVGKLEKLLEEEYKEGAVKICEDAVNSLKTGGADGTELETIEAFNRQVPLFTNIYTGGGQPKVLDVGVGAAVVQNPKVLMALLDNRGWVLEIL